MTLPSPSVTQSLRNGVTIGEQVATVSVPYRVQHQTRYRLRHRVTAWAWCPECNWHTTSPSTVSVRRAALDHDCEDA